MTSFDEMFEQLKLLKQTEGYIWMNCLVKFNLAGEASIVRSFTRPAEMSSIKNIIKEKKVETKIETSKDIGEKSLFD